MTTPTTHGVIKRLGELPRMLAEATDEYAQLSWRRDRDFASAFLAASGTVAQRRRQALAATADIQAAAEKVKRRVAVIQAEVRQ